MFLNIACVDWQHRQSNACITYVDVRICMCYDSPYVRYTLQVFKTMQALHSIGYLATNRKLGSPWVGGIPGGGFVWVVCLLGEGWGRQGGG